VDSFKVSSAAFVIDFSGDNDRDVFNEKPSKEELISATQVSLSLVIIPCYIFSLMCLS